MDKLIVFFCTCFLSVDITVLWQFALQTSELSNRIVYTSI